MRILAIECSTRQPSVAILECNTDLSVESGKYFDALFRIPRPTHESGPQFVTVFDSDSSEPSGNSDAPAHQSASQSLIPLIETGLSSAGLKATDIDLVAVTQGPGSFTSLRIGVVAAKTFAFAANCQIAGVDSMRALVYQALEQYQSSESGDPLQRVAVAINAGRGELFAGVYEASNHFATPQRNIVSPNQWLTGLTGHSIVTGDGVKLLDVKSMEAKPTLSLADTSSRQLTAKSVAVLGALQFANQGSDDLWKLQPHYFRPSAAEEKRNLADNPASAPQPMSTETP